jgi:hypothetical protein
VLDKLTQGNWIKTRTGYFSAGIIFIYAAPHSEIKKDDFDEKTEARVKELKYKNFPVENLYFCYTDKNDAPKVWGHTLDRLIELMKTKEKGKENASDSSSDDSGMFD